MIDILKQEDAKRLERNKAREQRRKRGEAVGEDEPDITPMMLLSFELRPLSTPSARPTQVTLPKTHNLSRLLLSLQRPIRQLVFRLLQRFPTSPALRT